MENTTFWCVIRQVDKLNNEKFFLPGTIGAGFVYATF
jgi:hypothetical protein